MSKKTRGIGNVDYVRQGSEVAVQDQPFWDFLYLTSTVKSDKYNVGDRTVTPDGRVFRYCKAAATCDPEFGAYNPIKTIANAVAPTQTVISGPILNSFGSANTTTAGSLGANVVTITVGATGGAAGDGVIAEDELRGGSIVIGNGTSQHPQMRGIIGNTAVASGGGTCDVYLDASLISAVAVGTTNIEAMLNPYANVKGDQAGGAYVSFLGMPAARATVGQYFWLQTWGPCWITSDGTTGAAANGRVLYFADNGSVVSSDKVTDGATNVLFQPAGFALDASSAGASNAPMVMLQISI
jgi:hypothetical protein